jgi:hypothetical protein
MYCKDNIKCDSASNAPQCQLNNGVWCIKTCCQTLKHFDNDMSICCWLQRNKSFYKYIYSLIIFWFITMKQWSATRNDSKPVLLIFPTALQIQQITQGVHMTIGRPLDHSTNHLQNTWHFVSDLQWRGVSIQISSLWTRLNIVTPKNVPFLVAFTLSG